MINITNEQFQKLVDFPDCRMIKDAGDGRIVTEMFRQNGLVDALQYLHGQHVRPNARIYTKLLQMSSNEPPERVSALFNSIKTRGMANVFTYNSFITAAGNAGNFDEA